VGGVCAQGLIFGGRGLTMILMPLRPVTTRSEVSEAVVTLTLARRRMSMGPTASSCAKDDRETNQHLLSTRKKNELFLTHLEG
jgi:hypothetical protein